MDAMTPAQQFKFAFLLQCARDGLGEEEILERIADLEKSAATVAEELVSGVKTVKNLTGGVIGQLANAGIYGGLALAGGSLAVGAAAGTGLAKVREGHADPAEARKQELIAAYNSGAEELHQHRFRAERPGPRPSFR